MNPFKRFIKRNSHSILLKPLAGLGRSINRLYENRNHDLHSNGELRVIRKIARTQLKVIIDAGANIGEYAGVLYSNCSNATIYCLEPVSRTFQELSDNLKGHTDRIRLIQAGLYKTDSELSINVFAGSAHASLHDIKGINYKPLATETISVRSGDSLLKELAIDHVDFLKLDIEGAEMDALIGLEESLSKKAIRAIQFEYGYLNITSKHLLADFYEFFSRFGYEIGKIYPKSVEFRPYAIKHEDFIGPNFLAVHSSDTELKNLLR